MKAVADKSRYGGSEQQKPEAFSHVIRGHGLKTTRQRDEIALWWLRLLGHLNADQIYR